MSNLFLSGTKERRLIDAVDNAVKTYLNEKSAEDATAELSDNVPLSLYTAAAAGLPVKMTYSVSECAKFTGINEDKLRRDRDRGFIDFIEPDGERGARISIYELDRYLKNEGVIA